MKLIKYIGTIIACGILYYSFTCKSNTQVAHGIQKITLLLITLEAALRKYEFVWIFCNFSG